MDVVAGSGDLESLGQDAWGRAVRRVTLGAARLGALLDGDTLAHCDIRDLAALAAYLEATARRAAGRPAPVGRRVARDPAGGALGWTLRPAAPSPAPRRAWRGLGLAHR